MFKFQQDNYKLELRIERLDHRIYLLEQKIITFLEYLDCLAKQ